MKKKITLTMPNSVEIEKAARSGIALIPPPAIPAERPLHLEYQIHWRTEFRWRSTQLALTGTHHATALTPEFACEAFAAKFPGRDITGIMAL